MVSAGRVLIMPKGAWNTTDTYSMLDLVSYNGSSYVAKQSVPANTLPTNTAYWQISAYGGDASNLAGNFATLETTDYASQDYNVHDFLVTKDSQFCEVIADISSGDEIVVDTNVKATDVGKLIQAVIASINNLDAENVKLKGKTAITTQTDLDDLTTIGNYYKKNTSVYVTNAPTSINEEITAVFRLTVENGSDDTDTLIQTIVQDNGNTYKRSYDGTNWSSWDQVVYKSSLGTKVSKSEVAPVESTSSASRAYAIGEQFYYEGVLKKATANIARGGTITPGTNCANADTLTAQNQTLTNEVSDISDEIADMNNILGAKNLLLTTAKTQTFKGVTFTKNSDGSITANGTATEDIGFTLARIADLGISGNCILSGCTGGDSENTFALVITNEVNKEQAQETSEITVNMADYSSPTYPTSAVYILIRSGVTISNKTFYPMLRLATDASADYQPYAMTNQQMTPYVQAISNPNLLDNPWFTVNQRGKSSYTVGGKYTLDRWYLQKSTANTSITVESDGILITSQMNEGIRQTAPKLANGEYTFSIMVNGTIYHKTVNVVNGAMTPVVNQQYDENLPYFCAIVENGDYSICYPYITYSNQDVSDIKINAVKLEKGKVSTLAMDIAPNYATELLKCQMYYQRFDFVQDATIASALVSTNWASFIIPTEKMRITPSKTITGTINAVSSEDISSSFEYITETAGGYVIHGARNTNGTMVSGYYSGGVGGVVIELSAEL